jgi:hypothetical protein
VLFGCYSLPCNYDNRVRVGLTQEILQYSDVVLDWLLHNVYHREELYILILINIYSLF